MDDKTQQPKISRSVKRQRPSTKDLARLEPFALPSITRAKLVKAPPIHESFYARNALAVAPDLLGKVMVVGTGPELCAAVVCEVEAYQGEDDPASHAFRGKTKRNASMFGRGGIAYVYLSYGMHYCVNVVTGKEETGEAVLIRAALPLFGLETMAKRRSRPLHESVKKVHHLASGPGKLTSALGISLLDNGRRWDQDDFKIVDLGFIFDPALVQTSRRIGISKGIELPWRFFLHVKGPIPAKKSLTRNSRKT